jgi:hypothetical protein
MSVHVEETTGEATIAKTLEHEIHRSQPIQGYTAHRPLVLVFDGGVVRYVAASNPLPRCHVVEVLCDMSSAQRWFLHQTDMHEEDEGHDKSRVKGLAVLSAA